MPCNNCSCLDCNLSRGVAKAMNRSNDMGEDPAPIHCPSWRDVEPANEVQAKAWGELVDAMLERSAKWTKRGMGLMAAVNLVCRDIPGLKEENRLRVSAQVERFIRESPKYELRQGAAGGLFKRGKSGGSGSSVSIPLSTSVAINNHTCPGCGNTACSKDEKSCWKCGGSL
jgi:hypothetical protein